MSDSAAFVVMHHTYSSHPTVSAVCLTKKDAEDLCKELEATIIDPNFDSYSIQETEIIL